MSDNKNDKENKLGDLFKKVVSTGIGAAFMTEDAVKGIIGELPLPKEIISNLLQNARATKEEFVASVKQELKGYLDKIDVSKEIEKILERYDLDVQAKISFTKKPEVAKTPKKKE